MMAFDNQILYGKLFDQWEIDNFVSLEYIL